MQKRSHIKPGPNYITSANGEAIQNQENLSICVYNASANREAIQNQEQSFKLVFTKLVQIMKP